nr:hypothetical protein [Tanacetum cinerariifolium]
QSERVILWSNSNVNDQDGYDIDVCRVESKHISKAAGTGLIPEKVEACLKLLEVDSPELFTCKSALFDGCRFALALKNMEKENMWKVMSQVWIKLTLLLSAEDFTTNNSLRKGT